jgi:dCTP deaminase
MREGFRVICYEMTMYLSDRDIVKAIESGDVVLRDFDRKRIQPASYDVLLGNKFVVTDQHTTEFIDPVKGLFANTHEVEVKDGEYFVLHPRTTVLGMVRDFVGSKKYLIQLSGKSSLARIGLVVHNTAGIVNPGHFLNITLELSNLNIVPIVLRPGMPIAQLTFSELSSPVSTDYEKTGRFSGDNWKKNFALPKKTKKLGVKKKTSKK